MRLAPQWLGSISRQDQRSAADVAAQDGRRSCSLGLALELYQLQLREIGAKSVADGVIP